MGDSFVKMIGYYCYRSGKVKMPITYNVKIGMPILNIPK
jgi:hypothetical protein